MFQWPRYPHPSSKKQRHLWKHLKIRDVSRRKKIYGVLLNNTSDKCVYPTFMFVASSVEDLLSMATTFKKLYKSKLTTENNFFFLKITWITVYSFVCYSTIIYLLRPSITDISTRVVYFHHETLSSHFVSYSKPLFTTGNSHIQCGIQFQSALVKVSNCESHHYLLWTCFLINTLLVQSLCLSLLSLKFHSTT